MRRDDSLYYHLRWGRNQWRSLEHSDLAKAKQAARDQSAILVAGRQACSGGQITLGARAYLVLLETLGWRTSAVASLRPRTSTQSGPRRGAVFLEPLRGRNQAETSQPTGDRQ